MPVSTATIERFSGFADLYDEYRPQPPILVTEIIGRYLGHAPKRVVDLGCGTGLSTFLWRRKAREIVGIDPNEDMLKIAADKNNKVEGNAITFKRGDSGNTGFPRGYAHVVTCSQSFHWMEPRSTIAEVSRILGRGGVFAVYDCAWPPTVDRVAEAAYQKLMERCKNHRGAPLQDSAKQWDKQRHYKNIKDSGKFRFVKEILFHNWEKSDAKRFVGLALSQGGLQVAMKRDPAGVNKQVERFRRAVNQRFGTRVLEIMFSYRMVLGVR